MYNFLGGSEKGAFDWFVGPGFPLTMWGENLCPIYYREQTLNMFSLLDHLETRLLLGFDSGHSRSFPFFVFCSGQTAGHWGACLPPIDRWFRSPALPARKHDGGRKLPPVTVPFRPPSASKKGPGRYECPIPSPFLMAALPCVSMVLAYRVFYSHKAKIFWLKKIVSELRRTKL